MSPKGKLFIIGGHEDKGEEKGQSLTIHKKKISKSHFEILGTLILHIPRAHQIIEIIASASSIPEKMEALYIECCFFYRRGPGKADFAACQYRFIKSYQG